MALRSFLFLGMLISNEIQGSVYMQLVVKRAVGKSSVSVFLCDTQYPSFHIWCLMKVRQIALRPAKLFLFSWAAILQYDVSKHYPGFPPVCRYCRWQSYLHVEYVALWLTLLLLCLFSGNVTPVTQLCVDLWRLITTL